jgi:hypothetical protein
MAANKTSSLTDWAQRSWAFETFSNFWRFICLQGGSQQLMEEKKRQEAMEDNYNLVWNQDGFASASGSKSSLEHEDNDENRQAK